MDPGGSELDSSLPQPENPCLIVEDSQPDSVALEDDPESSYRALLARRLSSLQPTARSPVLVGCKPISHLFIPTFQGCFIDSVVDDDDGGCVIRCFMEDTQQNKSPCLLTAAGRQWKNAPAQVKLLQLS